MYRRTKGLVIGFHGCTKTIAEELVCSNKSFQAKHKKYHWLGQGIYFWENNQQRALKFAQESLERKEQDPKDAAVVGVVLRLGNCLNLLESDSLDLLKVSYDNLKADMAEEEFNQLENRGIDKSGYPMLRFLDCAVIDNLVNSIKESEGEYGPPVDSILGMFLEGNDLYTGAGIKNKTHVQICVVNPNCIKGVFHPKKRNSNYLSI